MIALWLWLGAFGFAYVALQALAIPSQPGSQLSAMGLILCVVLAALAVALGIIARGLWNMKAWARASALCVAELDIVAGVLLQLAGVVEQVGWPLYASLGISVLVIIYLLRGHVAQRFA
ncbi:MAG TPA: hypothetical protein VM536_13080 [Chloroflexia bacterium]|nr:hypothetical protein [Chloroflexia bacterium]